VAVWLLMAATLVVLAFSLGGSYNNSFSLPNTESTRAQTLLEEIPGASDAFTVATATVVWSPAAGAATAPEVSEPVVAMLTTIADVPGVACVVTPYGPPLGTDCPQQPASSGQAGAGEAPAGGEGDFATADGAGLPAMSPETARVLAGLGPAGFSVDGRVGFATVTFGAELTELDAADAEAVVDAVAAANGVDELRVGASGQALDYAGQEPPSSEAIGIAVALIILLFTFGSLVGAFLPVLSAVLSLGVAQALVLIVAKFLDVATFAPTLAAMIGLGVGIDYALFVMNRYKQALDAGREPRAAAHEAVRTSGRAVVFAAATVIIALLGLFVTGITFFNGLGAAASFTVVMMMLGATLLLPAVLSILGRRAFAIRMPWARRHKPGQPGGAAFARYGLWLERRYRVVGALALVALIVVALPVGALRLGFTDDGGREEGTPQRIAYDLRSEGFGPGINGPFVVAVETAEPGDNASVQQLAGAIGQDPGVAAAIAFPMAPEASVTAMQVVPTSAPQDVETTQLLDRLRQEVIPDATASGAVGAYVGGTQAITSDFTAVIRGTLPIFLSVVIGLGFLALVLLFRSVLVPLTGVITSLLSLGAVMGVTVAVFQWGWFADVVGITGTGPIQPFLPIMVFAILFGLSMDYHVFLVSRMQEEWGHTGDNRTAVRRGLAASGRVVAIAAAIMISVFAAFMLADDSTIKLFGLALATAVLFDAYVVRLIIVPSLMYEIRRANWWLPRWLGRLLPTVVVESEEEVALVEAEIADVPDAAEAPRARS
jgi:RND superfamily putative drug exporter